MADTLTATKKQSLNEIRQWDIDFSPDCLAGVSVASATATHEPPSGAASTPAVGAIVSNVVPVMLGPLAVVGKHYLIVLATLDNGEKSEAKLAITVVDL